MNIKLQTVCNDAFIKAPFGRIRIAIHDHQLMIELLALPADVKVLPSHAEVTLEAASTHLLVSLVSQQVLQYLQHASSTFDLATQQDGTTFQKKVWQAIAAIPCGQTRTYSELAQQIGSGPRAVANACGANRLPLLIPCHRVVAKSGLGGFMQGTHNGLLIKQWLLQHESSMSGGGRHE